MVLIKTAFAGDKETILKFGEEHFQKNWVYEVEYAMMQSPSKCFIATEEGKIIGFACYDASAKGFFDPIGVLPETRKKNVGTALLLHTFEACVHLVMAMPLLVG